MRSTLIALSIFFAVVASSPENTPASSTDTPGSRCDANSDCATYAWEPLNVLDNSGNVLPEVGGTADWNPSDSPGSEGFKWNTSQVDMQFIAIGSAPVSLTGRDYVLYSNRGDGSGGLVNGNAVDGNGTGCARLCHIEYVLLHEPNPSALYSFHTGNSCAPSSQDKRHKFHTYQWDGGGQWQITGGNPNPCQVGPFDANTSMSPTSETGDATIDIDNLIGAWYRLETCVETDGTDLEDSSSTVIASFRSVKVSDGTTNTRHWNGLTANGPLSQSHLDHNRQNQGSTTDASEERYMAGLGQFCYATAGQSKWPGPDCNIEPSATECL